MRYCVMGSEQLALVATIDPQSTSTEVNSDVIDMKYYRRLLIIVSAGAFGSSGTVDVDVEIDTDSGMGTNLTTLKSITQLVDGDDDKQVLIEVTAEEVCNGIANYHGLGRYVRVELTAATAATLVSVVVLASCNRYGPADEYDLASVDEIVE